MICEDVRAEFRMDSRATTHKYTPAHTHARAHAGFPPHLRRRSRGLRLLASDLGVCSGVRMDKSVTGTAVDVVGVAGGVGGVGVVGVVGFSVCTSANMD